MKRLSIPIHAEPDALRRMADLQSSFSRACLSTFEIARRGNCFSRVALHHLAYRSVRALHEDLGSQLVSNAIYVVCAAYKAQPGGLTEAHFGPNLPVVLDRKTVSLTAGQISIFTLEGRMRLDIKLDEQLTQIFKGTELKEMQLQRTEMGGFSLVFFLKGDTA